MDHILHIFRKDGRRHWPEILASLILLALYAHLNVHPWQKADDRFFLFGTFFSLKGSVTPFLLLFWSFTIVRVVQSETLVGDRQWWITKPYEWWELLAAKLLFIVVVILIPVFFVQIYLLHGAGFPVLNNLAAILTTELGLFLFPFFPCFCLASLSKGVGQALLGVVVFFLGAWAIFWVTENAPSGNMSNFADASQFIQTALFFGAIAAAALLQFARRKTWWSRILVLAAFCMILLVARFTPYAKYLEGVFPLVANAPAQISVRPPNESLGNHALWNTRRDISLSIPVKVSGVNKNHIVLIDEMKLTLKTSEGKEWSHGWRSQVKELWPGDERENLSYQMKRKDYEELKGSTVQVQMELALWEFQEQDVTELVATAGLFRDPRLGICHLGSFRPFSIECFKPLHSPGLMATIDPKQAQCSVSDEDNSGPNLTLVHAWLRPPSDGDFPEPGITPLTDYSIYFSPTKKWVPPEDASGRGALVPLCPGTRIKLATPKETWRGRVKFQLDNIPFDALVAGSFQE